MTETFSALPAAFQQRSRVRFPAPGLAVSIVVHALALAWLWHSLPPRPADMDARPKKTITFRLVPPVAKAPPAVVPAVAVRTPLPPPSTPRQAHAVTAPAQPAPRAPAIIAMPATPNAPDEPAAVAADTPAFDLAAARATARLVTREERRGVVARPGRVPAEASYVDQRTGERFESARRADCKTARSESMNLYANVFLLAKDMITNATNDSGCKW
jgi:hypothetical protein